MDVSKQTITGWVFFFFVSYVSLNQVIENYIRVLVVIVGFCVLKSSRRYRENLS